MIDKPIILQAHRGSHVHFPENSLGSCLSAFDIDITCIEIDVVVTKDKKLVISHDPYISSKLHHHSDGREIEKSLESKLNIYEMDFKDLSLYPFKSKSPENSEFSNVKTSLRELVKAMNNKAIEENIYLPTLNIEIKSQPKYYNKFFPFPEEYAELIENELENFPNKFPFLIQSFDWNLLQLLINHIQIEKLILLIDKPELEDSAFQEALNLGIRNFGLNTAKVTPNFIEFCLDKNLNMSLWTVNDEVDLMDKINLGVGNIITDKAREFAEILKSKGFEIKKL